MSLLEPKKISKTYEQIVDYIREAIASERLLPGDRLPTEKELAALFGVSRPTIREALKVLEALNVLRSSTGPSGGIFVKKLDGFGVAEYLKDSIALLLNINYLTLQELGAARKVIEPPLASQAALHRTNEHLLRLRETIDEDQLKENFALAADISFHRCIAEAAQNRLLGLLVDAIHQALQTISKSYVIPDMKVESQRQHLSIYEAIEKKDQEAAEAQMREHLQFANEIYTNAVRLRQADVS